MPLVVVHKNDNIKELFMPPGVALMTDHDIRLALMEKRQEDTEARLAELVTKLEGFDSVKDDIKEIAVAWRSAGAVLTFVKALAAMCLALGVIVATIKYGFQGGGGK